MTPHVKTFSTKRLPCLTILLSSIFVHTVASAENSLWQSFLDPKDGKLDASNWLIERSGFLPVPVIVSDPSVGYGGGLAVLFFMSLRRMPKNQVKTMSSRSPPASRLAQVSIQKMRVGRGLEGISDRGRRTR
mgnify:FL=1